MSTAPVPKRAGSARILMVDHNKSGLAARKAVLEELGHRVTIASRAEDAMEHFSKTDFDLLVTENRASKMNGLELIRNIREMESRVPIILLSGDVEALGLTESGTGADVVLSKSANEVTHLIRAVSRLLRPRTARKPPSIQNSASRAKRRTS